MSELSDLMGRDPLLLTKADVTEIVNYHRANLERYVAGIKAPKAKAEPSVKGSADLSALKISL